MNTYSPRTFFCIYRFLVCCDVSHVHSSFLPKFVCIARVDMFGLLAWTDDLNVIFCEFLDDDTKLALSCRNWLHVQHWCVVAPDPAMRVTLAALSRHTASLNFFNFSRIASRNTGETTSGLSFAWVPHGFALVCAVKQDLSFLFHPVTRTAAIAAMVLVFFAGARRRALVNTFFFFRLLVSCQAMYRGGYRK